MATATINGKPNIFKTPEVPAPINPVSYEDRITEAVNIATKMVAETYVTDAEMTDEDFLNDPETQAELNAWCEKLEAEWLADPEAQAEFDAWISEQERLAEEAEMEQQAEEWENSRLGMAYAEELNAHPFRFTGGAA